MSVRLESNLEEIAREMERRAGELVRKTLHEIEAGAKQNAPVDEGTLRNSYQVEMTSDLSGNVGSAAEHAPHQEYGTRFQPGKAHLIPAAEAARAGFEQGLKELVD